MSHPLTNTMAEITMLEERCRQQAARIWTLEAALREIETTCMDAYIHGHPNIINALMDITARAAIDKDARK